MASVMAAANVLAFALRWEPEIRGITTVLVAIAVLMGGTYLILLTNLGARLGMLIALAAFFGWMVLMGAVWWVYGIGMRGSDPSWEAEEVVVGELAEQATTEEALTLQPSDEPTNGWTLLAADNPGTGQAQASADEILIDSGVFQTVGDYEHQRVFDKDQGTRFFTLLHNPHYAIVEVQRVQSQIPEPGRPAGDPVLDNEQPPVYVVMVRNLGDRRFPAGAVTVVSVIMFGIFVNMLHRRDKASMQARAAVGAAPPERVPVGVGAGSADGEA